MQMQVERRMHVLEGHPSVLLGVILAAAFCAVLALLPQRAAADPSDRTSLDEAVIASVVEKTYTGKAIKPQPKLTINGVRLKPGVDYTLSYRNNTQAGEATILIRGRGAYEGKRALAFTILPRSIEAATVSDIEPWDYDGSSATPEPSVTLGDVALEQGRDYVLAYRNNAVPGTATVVVQGKGNYAGSLERDFVITGELPDGPVLAVPSTSGALAVDGSQLVDSKGRAVELHGVSTHGLAWFPQYVNDRCFGQLRDEWGANVVRLALYTADYNGYCSGGNKSQLKKLVKDGVDYATKHDLYVIVDWHILSDNNPLSNKAEAKSFFKEMSSALKDHDNVLYEICNEPNGGTGWADIKTYANEVIPVIRANDPDAVILVGTPTWSQEIDKPAKDPLRFDNVMYTLHFYAATHKDDLRNRLVDAVRGGLPVFVSEFGVCEASGNGSVDEASANAWVSTMKSLGVSWCMWSLCNKAESASLIKSSCGASYGFRQGDLTQAGTWLLKALGGELPAGTVAPGSNPGTPDAPDGEAVSLTSGSFTCVLTPSNSWQDGSQMCYQYEMAITNNGAACSAWSVTIPFNKAISYLNGWNGTYQAKGSKLVISNAGYNGALATGATLTGIGFQLKADAGLVVTP